MGVTDSGIQTPTPEGFGLKSMEQGGDAIDTGLTPQQASDRINDPGMQLGQQTTSGLDQVYPMQSLSGTSTDIQNMFGTDLSYDSLGNTLVHYLTNTILRICFRDNLWI
jgi:hypothetical protein